MMPNKTIVLRSIIFSDDLAMKEAMPYIGVLFPNLSYICTPVERVDESWHENFIFKPPTSNVDNEKIFMQIICFHD